MKRTNLILGAILGILTAVIFAVPTKAVGMPCTEATLKDAQALKVIADQELAAAIQAQNEADLKVKLLRQQGVTGLPMQIATDAATNAANLVRDYKGKVANAQQFIDAVTSRGITEQYQLDMEEKWRQRAVLDLTKMSLDASTEMSSAALANVNALQAAAATAPTDAALAALQSQLATSQAQYAASKAATDAIAANYNALLNSNKWATNEDNANYIKFVQEYGTSLAKIHECKTRDGRDIKITYYVPDKPNEWSIRWFE